MQGTTGAGAALTISGWPTATGRNFEGQPTVFLQRAMEINSIRQGEPALLPFP
jgi:hypothetical protein